MPFQFFIKPERLKKLLDFMIILIQGNNGKDNVLLTTDYGVSYNSYLSLQLGTVSQKKKGTMKNRTETYAYLEYCQNSG